MTRVGQTTVSAALVLLGFAASPARAADVTNLLAPSALETAVADNPLIAVRRISGGTTSVCTIRAKGVSWDCSTLGAPPGGVATGPSLTAMPKLGAPNDMKWRFVFVRSGNGGLYERHIDLYGAGTPTWSPWSTSMLGALPGGAVASSALVASHGMQTISVAVRDTANRVWVNRAGIGANDALPTFGGWVQVAADNTSSAPAPALSDWASYVFALGPTARVRYSMCQYPSCYGSWSFMPQTTQTFNEGIQTYSLTEPENGHPYVRIAGTNAGSVWFATMDMQSLVSSGFGQYLPPTGRAADSTPAVVKYGTGSSALIVVHLNNQRYGMLDISGPTWTQLPALP